MKLIDISAVLGEKDLSEVLKEPKPYDLAAVAYCLLDEESKQKIESAKVTANDQESDDVDIAHKLYYLMCENNIQNGLTNYTSVLQTVTEIVMDSTVEAEQSKKKVLHRLFPWIPKKFTIV